MTTSLFDQWSKFNKTTYEPFMEFSAFATRYWADCAKQGLQLTSDMVQAQAEQFNHLAQVKSPEEYLNQQTKLMLKQAPKMYEYAEESFNILQKGAKEYSKLVQKYCDQVMKTDTKSDQK